VTWGGICDLEGATEDMTEEGPSVAWGGVCHLERPICDLGGGICDLEGPSVTWERHL